MDGKEEAQYSTFSAAVSKMSHEDVALICEHFRSAAQHSGVPK